MYRLNSNGREIVYAKKNTVSRANYHRSEFSLVAIPDVSSSAILAEKYNKLVGSSAEELACCILMSFFGVFACPFYFFLSHSMFPEGDFWRFKGTLSLFLSQPSVLYVSCLPHTC